VKYLNGFCKEISCADGYLLSLEYLLKNAGCSVCKYMPFIDIKKAFD
jgi:hypothetical protein